MTRQVRQKTMRDWASGVPRFISQYLDQACLLARLKILFFILIGLDHWFLLTSTINAYLLLINAQNEFEFCMTYPRRFTNEQAVTFYDRFSERQDRQAYYKDISLTGRGISSEVIVGRKR